MRKDILRIFEICLNWERLKRLKRGKSDSPGRVIEVTFRKEDDLRKDCEEFWAVMELNIVDQY